MAFFEKLRAGLRRTKEALFGRIDALFRAFVKIDEDFFDELEETLITADVGVETTEYILDTLRQTLKEKRITDPAAVREELYALLSGMMGEDEGLRLDTVPSVILVIGVNGVGKTTSIGKMAASLKGEGKRVIVAAADTFRAAAAEQLKIWCDRAGVDMIRQGAERIRRQWYMTQSARPAPAGRTY